MPENEQDRTMGSEPEKTAKKPKKAKEKITIMAVKCEGGVIAVETEIDQIRLEKLPIGTVLRMMPLKDNRNYQHHKKFFKLLSEAFPYWEPEFKVLTDAEEWLGKDIENGMNEIFTDLIIDDNARNAIQEAIQDVIKRSQNRLTKRRQDKLDYEGMKTLEGFLDYVMKKAGCFNVVPLPDGGSYRQRWSIAFDNMPQSQFNDVYKRCFGVIWNEVLSDVFASEEELESRVNMLLSFD